MKYIPYLILSAFCLSLPVHAQTPGTPHVSIPSSTLPKFKALLTSKALENGGQLVSETPSQMVFKGNLGTGAAILMKAFLGNGYSSQPTDVFTFTFATAGSSTEIYMHGRVDMRGIFGQQQGFEHDTSKDRKFYQGALEKMRALTLGQKGGWAVAVWTGRDWTTPEAAAAMNAAKDKAAASQPPPQRAAAWANR